ncbi:MAG: glutaredoxin family protein [Nitrospinota bacterium]|nr:glutaredoxin family protein [Nitrospinota bacterium]
MKEFLSHHGVPYREHLIDRDPAALDALVEKTGRRATPVLLIGDETVVGFDRRKISNLLGLK